MKRRFCYLLSILMISLSISSSALAGEVITAERELNTIVIDVNSLTEVYERYSGITDEEEIIKMLMSDFHFTEAETRELMEISKQGNSNPMTRASSITGTLPVSAAIGTVVNIVYFIDFKEMKDLATITKFIARQVGAGGAGVAVAATIAQVVFTAFQKGGINWARVTVSYTYGYTNDGVLGWTPGYTKYEYGA